MIDQTDRPAKLGTAALPAAVLAAIADCAEACRGTLRELDGECDRLRAALDRRIRPAPDGPTRRLCAVDGSNATVPATGATFAAIAAAAVEEDTLTDQDVLVRLLPPIEELESILADDDWRLVLQCRRVVAHPKSATAADDVLELAPHLSGTVTDRTLWTSVLNAGEHSLPVHLNPQGSPPSAHRLPQPCTG